MRPDSSTVVDFKQYDIVILAEPQQHQQGQLCRLLKQLEVGAKPQHVNIAVGGSSVEQVRKALYECPTNVTSNTAYFLPDSLFRALHTFRRGLDVGIANLYQVLCRHFAHESFSLSLSLSLHIYV